MTERIEPVRRRRGPLPPAPVVPVRDEPRDERPAAEPPTAAGTGERPRRGDGHGHIDVLA